MVRAAQWRPRSCSRSDTCPSCWRRCGWRWRHCTGRPLQWCCAGHGCRTRACRQVNQTEQVANRSGPRPTWTTSRSFWSVASSPAKTGLCGQVDWAVSYGDTQPVEEGTCGSRFIRVVRVPRSQPRDIPVTIVSTQCSLFDSLETGRISRLCCGLPWIVV